MGANLSHFAVKIYHHDLVWCYLCYSKPVGTQFFASAHLIMETRYPFTSLRQPL